MKSQNKLLTLAIVLVIVSLIVFIHSYRLKNAEILEEWSVYVRGNVSNHSGFDLTPGVLSMGAVVPGSSSERRVKVDNSYPFPIYVFMSSNGTISKYLYYNTREKIGINESKSISIIFSPDENASEGFYDGYLTYKIKQAE